MPGTSGNAKVVHLSFQFLRSPIWQLHQCHHTECSHLLWSLLFPVFCLNWLESRSAALKLILTLHQLTFRDCLFHPCHCCYHCLYHLFVCFSFLLLLLSALPNAAPWPGCHLKWELEIENINISQNKLTKQVWQKQTRSPINHTHDIILAPVP